MNACDGVFGNATAQGVKDFQNKFYLELADGIVGTETKTELWNQRGQAFKYLWGKIRLIVRAKTIGVTLINEVAPFFAQ